jgi:O-antigen/teichoic acid export membrane protein
MSGNRLIAKNTAILYLRLIISSLIGLFSSRIVIKSLGISDYGLYSVVGGVVVLMSFINTIMIATTYRFIAYELGKGEEGKVNEVFNISLLLHIVMAGFVVLLTETLGVYYTYNYLNVEPDRIEDAVFVLRISSYTMVLTILSIPFQGLLTAQENFLVRASIEIIRSFLSLFVAVSIFYYLGNKLRFYALLILVANFVPAVLFFIYSRWKYYAIVRWQFQKSFKKYKEILVFSGWNTLGTAALVGQNTGTPLIINSFFGTTMNAAFGIANQVKGIISQFAMNLAQAAVPQITKSYSSGDTNRSINIVAYTSKYTWFLMLFPSLPVLLETEYLLDLWLAEVPDFAVAFTQLMILYTLVRGLGNGLMAIVQANGDIRIFQIVLSITTLIGLPIGYILYKTGLNAPTIITVFIITGLLNAVFFQLLLNKMFRFDFISFFKTSYLRVFYVATALTPLFFLIELFNEGLGRVLLFSLFSLVWLLLTIFYLGFESFERKYIVDFIVKKFNQN